MGSFIAATLLGIVFAKASRPKKRSRTVLFSEKAVIGKRDDRLCLMFRVSDLRDSQLVECHIQVEMFYTRETEEGELPYFHERLRIGNGINEEEDDVQFYTFMIIPNTIAHVINKGSPLYGMSSLDMLKANVELVVILEGVIESTGLTMQARTSYTGHEIVWGKNFAPLPRHNDILVKGELLVDFRHFNELVTVRNMPVCSAKDYERLKRERGTQSVSSAVEEVMDDHCTMGVKNGKNGTQETKEVSLKSNDDACEVIGNGLLVRSLSEVSCGVSEDDGEAGEAGEEREHAF